MLSQHGGEIGSQHGQRVVAVGPRMPVGLAAVDRGHHERRYAGRHGTREQAVVAELVERVAVGGCPAVQQQAHRQWRTRGDLRRIRQHVADATRAARREERRPYDDPRIRLGGRRGDVTASQGAVHHAPSRYQPRVGEQGPDARTSRRTQNG